MEKNISTHILTYRGQILVIRHCNNTNVVNLTVYGYCKDTRHFVRQKDKERQLSGMDGLAIRVTGFECIVEYETGIKQPCLLVENHCGRNGQFSLHLFFLVNSSSLVKVAAMNVGSSISSVGYRLTDGPCVCWVNRNQLDFLKWNRMTKSLEHSSHICTSDQKHCSSLKLLWSGVMNNKLVAIATVRRGNNNTEWLFIDFERGLLPNEKLLPSVYSSTALCCFVTDESAEHQRIYVGTSMKQLIGFKQGKLVSHCQLPFDDPCHIMSMRMGQSAYVIVQSKMNKVCAINCSQNKIVQEWSDKAFLLTDDFLERGIDQLCLLQEAPLGDELTNFLLTNMNDICITPEKENQYQERQTQDVQNLESLHTTIQALRTRLQANTASLNEKTMERDEKRGMIDATCSMLQRMSLATPPTTNVQQTKIKDSSCVCLIEGRSVAEEDDLASGGEEANCPAQPGPRVLAVWQRLLADKWVIGVEVENTQKCAMTDISLSLVSVRGEGNIQSWCHKQFDTNNPRLVHLVPGGQDQGLEEHDTPDCVPRQKRRKVDDGSICLNEPYELKTGEKTCVVCVTELPSFEREPEYSCSLVLSWTRYHDDHLPCTKATRCGYVDLSVNQLDELSIANTTGRSQDMVTRARDVMAVRAVSMATTLFLSSTISNLFDIVNIIRQGLQLPERVVGDVTSSSDDCLRHAYGINGSLQGVAVLVRPGYRQAQVHLFTRCSSQIHILIHRLRQALPDDVIIDVIDSAEEKAEAQVLARVQRNLTDMMNKTINKDQALNNNVSEKETSFDQTSDLIDVGDVRLRKTRLDYEKKRKV